MLWLWKPCLGVRLYNMLRIHYRMQCLFSSMLITQTCSLYLLSVSCCPPFLDLLSDTLRMVYLTTFGLLSLLSDMTRMQDVMTHIPETIDPSTSVNEALHLMHSKHFLHLPVVRDNSFEVVGLLDVVQLTLSVLDLTTPNCDKLSKANELDDSRNSAVPTSDEQASTPASPPVYRSAWDVFWASALFPFGGEDDNCSRTSKESEADMRGVHATRKDALVCDGTNASDISIPASSADGEVTSVLSRLVQAPDAAPFSYIDEAPTLESAAPVGQQPSSRKTCLFKLKLPEARVYRFEGSATSLDCLKATCISKMTKDACPHDEDGEINSSDIRSQHSMQLGYIDIEGDYVALLGDEDLRHAVELADKWQWSTLTLHATEKVPDLQGIVENVFPPSARTHAQEAAQLGGSPSGAYAYAQSQISVVSTAAQDSGPAFALDITFRPNNLVLIGVGVVALYAAFRISAAKLK